MARPIAYGIDFGTTNSLVSLAYKDRVEIITAGAGENPENLPSLVYLHRNGIAGAGVDAVRQYLVTGSARHSCGDCPVVAFNGREFVGPCNFAKPGGGCYDARLLSELKAFLSDTDLDKTHSWGRDYLLEDLVAVILRNLKRLADRRSGVDVRRAVIGHPIAYPGAEGEHFGARQRHALDRMKEAAAVAGFDEVILYQEPAAAVLAERGNGLMVAVDFGGGTFDVAVLRMEPGNAKALALQGAAVGGEDFDAALFQHALGPELGLHHLPARLSTKLARLSTTLRAVADEQLRADLRHFRGAHPGIEKLERIIFGGHTYQLFKAVEDAKIELSRSPETYIDFHRPGIDVAAKATREQFESLIEEPLERVFQQLDIALKQAGVAPEDVDVVLRTGGSSAIPAFITGLEKRFGPDKVQTRPAFSTIVAGLGEYARAVWS